MEIIKICFWLSIFLILYPILIYPTLVFLLGLIWPRTRKRRSWCPSVTVLIPAYNEAQNIAATIQNKLDQDYPRNQLEIIVISDGSTDGPMTLFADLVPRVFGSSGGNSARAKPRL